MVRSRGRRSENVLAWGSIIIYNSWWLDVLERFLNFSDALNPLRSEIHREGLGFLSLVITMYDDHLHGNHDHVITNVIIRRPKIDGPEAELVCGVDSVVSFPYLPLPLPLSPFSRFSSFCMVSSSIMAASRIISGIDTIPFIRLHCLSCCLSCCRSCYLCLAGCLTTFKLSVFLSCCLS